MTDWHTGTIVRWHSLTASLATFQLAPAPGLAFPPYKGGQHIALRRDHCRLTRAVTESNGAIRYVPDVDEAGRQKFGAITHSYSIASAPFEAAAHDRLEFYIVLETHLGASGRLSSSLFEVPSGNDNTLSYVNRITGNFTLADRTRGLRNILMIGTGTGLAPFVSMLKQVDHESKSGAPHVRYTLLHANRTRRELGFHEELLAIEAGGRFDFLYLPSVSRPAADDFDTPGLGRGRASNLLRSVFGMPIPEEVVEPVLPAHVNRDTLLERLSPDVTVALTCGSPAAVAEIQAIAAARRLRVETEEW